MNYLSIDQLKEAIEETERQEAIFRLMDNHEMTAWWILERIKLRGWLHAAMLRSIR